MSNEVNMNLEKAKQILFENGYRLDESFDRTDRQVCVKIELDSDTCPDILQDYPYLFINSDGSINFDNNEEPEFMDVSVAEDIIDDIDISFKGITRKINQYYNCIDPIEVRDVYYDYDV